MPNIYKSLYVRFRARLQSTGFREHPLKLMAVRNHVALKLLLSINSNSDEDVDRSAGNARAETGNPDYCAMCSSPFQTVPTSENVPERRADTSVCW